MIVNGFDVVVLLVVVGPRVLILTFALVTISVVVATKGLNSLYFVVRGINVPVEMTVSLCLSSMVVLALFIHVADLTAVESWMRLLVHGLLNHEVDWLGVELSLDGVLTHDVLVAGLLIGSLFNVNAVVLFGLVEGEVLLQVVIVMRVNIPVMIFVAECAMDSVLMEVLGLDVVLVIVGVVKLVMGLVLGVVIVTTILLVMMGRNVHGFIELLKGFTTSHCLKVVLLRLWHVVLIMMLVVHDWLSVAVT